MNPQNPPLGYARVLRALDLMREEIKNGEDRNIEYAKICEVHYADQFVL